MNIYHCERNLNGYALQAVVSASAEGEVQELLDWRLDKDTSDIEIILIGSTENEIPQIWIEETL